jgi:putative membrane-bound dehydrogenase-like protein
MSDPRRLPLRPAAALLLAAFLLPGGTRGDDAPGGAFAPIFDGRSFAGWEHGDPHWRIEGGAITGEIAGGEELRENLFLLWQGEVHDFELRLKFRVTGHPSANSGVQFRSRALPGGGVAGYQADIDDGAVWLGRIYDEHGRGLVGERGEMVRIAPDGSRAVTVSRVPAAYRDFVRKGEWNDYAIRAAGSRLETWLNGERAAVLVDDQTGEQDFSGRLAIQLHSGPGPARIEIKDMRLRRLGKTDPPPPVAGLGSAARRAGRQGIEPTSAAGAPLNLGFEKGTLEGWKATGPAWERQPVKGDTVTPRRPGHASRHDGEFWLGGYEVAGDRPTGTLESEPFEVTHPFASFLVGGGAHRETRVEVVDAASGEVLHSASGREVEDMEPSFFRLEKHPGKKIFIRVVDESSGPWGHINFDDFRFHAEPPEAVPAADVPERVRTSRVLAHLRPNPAAAEPRTPADRTVAGMYVPEGFRVDLIAAEPDVLQPIALAIDERGRLWVAEAHSYPQKRPRGEGKDRILIFADGDGDGRFETRKVFADGLNLVSGLAVGHGGTWVGAAPELLFIPDADRDDVPDGPPRVLLDGWGFQDTHETLNSFTWGPDGWLYGCHGVFTRSLVGKPGASAPERVEIEAGVWRYHPVRHVFEVFARGGSNQWGLDFNAVGELFMTHCRSYWGGGSTTHVVRKGHYWNQANARHAPFISGRHPPGAPHFLNFLRASARYDHGEGGAGAPGSNAIYGGHSHVGAMIYLGDNWPDEYRDHLFTHNLHGHQINHQVNERRGAGYETVHGGRDMLHVPDPSYVAVELDYGPDGAVYIIDWVDRQHCHTPHAERWDRSNGRIYRMSWAATYRPRSVDLGRLSDLELARLQDHRSEWYARTARRVLQERSAARPIDAAAVAGVERRMAEARDPVEVLRRAWTLHAIGALSPAHHATLLEHADEHVRAWGIRLSTESQPVTGPAAARLVAMARSDPSSLVRLALASHLAGAPAADRWALAEALAAHEEDALDPYLPRMIWYGIAPLVGDDLARALALAGSTRMPALADFIRWYAAKTESGLARVLDPLAAKDAPADAGAFRDVLRLALFAVEGAPRAAPTSWRALSARLHAHEDEGIRRAAEELGAVFGDPEVLARMRSVLSGDGASPARRRQAFAILARSADPESGPVFLRLLDDPAFRSEAIPLLARSGHPEAGRAILSRFADLSGEDRRRAIGALIGRASLARELLEAMAAGRVEKRHLTSFDVRQLRALGDPAVNELLGRVWGAARETREEARATIARYARLYGDAPLWAYETGGGRKVFEQVCSSCHAVAGAGGTVGPDLAGSARNGLEYFLENIIDPGAVLGEDYKVTLIVKKDGEALSGLVESETEDAITLRLLTESRVVKKSEVASREKQDSSLMPEDLLKPLAEGQVIELLKYLMSLR